MPASLTAYVKARAADGDGRVAAAAANYAAALAGSPGNAVIAVRAYREALAAGDMTLARTAAAVMAAAGVAPADTALLTIADAVRAKNWTSAEVAAAALAKGPLDFLGPIVKAWIAFDRGGADPGADLAIESGNPLARRFNAENRALLLIAAGRPDAGVAALRGLSTVGAGNIDLRLAAAQLLAGKGRKDDALALIAGDDQALEAARAHLGKGARASAAFGISRLFDRLAVEIASGDARPLAIVLARAALTLDASDDRARLTLADALSRDGAQERALALLDAIDRKGMYGSAALGAKVDVLTRAGETRSALATATTVSNAAGAGSEDAQRLGDLLVAAGRFDDAADAYATAMARTGDAAGWVLFLQRGGALEQAGRWAEARTMLERAVALAPAEAVALNYLGYAQLERGENLPAARAMLERALKLQPHDAAITDSLGWAYVRTGDVARGLPLLERAARAQPADVTIQEHLGDAYWQVGRRYEARYAWRAAALYADGADSARLIGKLGSGLPR